MVVLLSLSESAQRSFGVVGGIQIRSFFFFLYKPPPPLSSPLFLCSALDSLMGWADKAIWKHVTGLVGATLHKYEASERRSGEPLEPSAAAAAAATCIQAGAHSKTTSTAILEKEKKLMLHVELGEKKKKKKESLSLWFRLWFLSNTYTLGCLCFYVRSVCWMMRFWLGFNARR